LIQLQNFALPERGLADLDGNNFLTELIESIRAEQLEHSFAEQSLWGIL
jgi:hypothetical protein